MFDYLQTFPCNLSPSIFPCSFGFLWCLTPFSHVILKQLQKGSELKDINCCMEHASFLTKLFKHKFNLVFRVIAESIVFMETQL